MDFSKMEYNQISYTSIELYEVRSDLKVTVPLKGLEVFLKIYILLWIAEGI